MQHLASQNLFWMDTLCIPVAPEHYDLRLDQIDKMASIYKGAAATLVLDYGLMTFPRPGWGFNESTCELRARIACSTWMTRCWTLQEGRLPRVLSILLDGGQLFTLGHSAAKDGYAESPPHRTIYPRFRSSSSKFTCIDSALKKAFYETFFQAEVDFVGIWNQMVGRSTTMAADVPLMLPTLLGLRSSGLWDFNDPAEVYQSVLLSIRQIPLSLFFTSGPRLSRDDIKQTRWIPNGIGKDILTRTNMATVGSKSFYYTLPVNGDVSIYIGDTALFTSTSRTPFRMADDDSLYAMDPVEEGSNPPFRNDCRSFCLIVERAEKIRKSAIVRGALFGVEKDDRLRAKEARWPRNLLWNSDSRIVLTYIGAVSVQRLQSSSTLLESGPTSEVTMIPCPLNIAILYGK